MYTLSVRKGVKQRLFSYCGEGELVYFGGISERSIYFSDIWLLHGYVLLDYWKNVILHYL